MKKFLSIAMLLMISIAVYAQRDVTKFLGIPVDGSKYEMIRKLKAKGFRSSSDGKTLVGDFNGNRVNVGIVTSNKKVWRIVVQDAKPTDEINIKIRFNKLCNQFANNPKYLPLEPNYTIPEEENIFYGINIHKKRYEADYNQGSDSKKPVWFKISNFLDSYWITMYYDNEYNEINGEDL